MYKLEAVYWLCEKPIYKEGTRRGEGTPLLQYRGRAGTGGGGLPVGRG